MKCPKCGYEKRETDTAREGECPKCGVFYAKVQPRVELKVQDTGPKAPADPPAAPVRRLSLPMWVLAALVGLVIGFLLGREHLKYEIRQTFQAAAEGIKTNVRAALGDNSRDAPETAENSEDRRVTKVEPFQVRMTAKGYQEADYSAQVDEAITFNLIIENKTGKDVRAFEGVLTFLDLLDNEVLSSKLTIDDPIQIDHELAWSGELEYNQFIDRHKRLRSAEESSLKVSFKTTKVLFADGTVLQP